MGGERGMPAIDELSFTMPDGKVQTFGPPRRGGEGNLVFLREIAAGTFQRDDGTLCCPICIDGDATDKEHVPQENLGGRVMTRTCAACNNGFGSKAEAALQDWFDHAYRRVTFDHEGRVPGRRAVPTMFMREGPDGSFALIVDGDFTPEIREMFAGGKLNMTFTLPDQRRCGLALLKHAYLAASLCLGHVPDTESVRAARADLIAARDAPKGKRLPDSAAAKRITVHRSHVGRQGPPLALVAKYNEETDDEPELMISLAGVLFVSWPFPDALPGTFEPKATA